MKYYFDRGQAGRVRKREGRKKRFRLLGVLLVLTALSFGLRAGWSWVLKKGALKITSIEVYGQRLVSAQAITDLAQRNTGAAFLEGGWKRDQ